MRALIRAASRLTKACTRPPKSQAAGDAQLVRLPEMRHWRQLEGQGTDSSADGGTLATGANSRQPQTVQHPNKPGTLTVAGKPGVDVPPGTLNAILKQAGLKK